MNRRIKKLLLLLTMILGSVLCGCYITHAAGDDTEFTVDDYQLISECEEALENKRTANRIEQVLLVHDPQKNKNNLQIFYFKDETESVTCGEVKRIAKNWNTVEDFQPFSETATQTEEKSENFDLDIIVNLKEPENLKPLVQYIKKYVEEVKGDMDNDVKVFYGNDRGGIECVSTTDENYSDILDKMEKGEKQPRIRNDQFAFIDEIVGKVADSAKSSRAGRIVILYVTDLTEKNGDEQVSEEYYKLREDLVRNNLPLYIIRPSEYIDMKELADGELLAKCAKCYGGDLSYIRDFSSFCGTLKSCYVKTYVVDEDMIDRGTRVIKLKLKPVSNEGDDEGVVRAVYIEGKQTKQDAEDNSKSTENTEEGIGGDNTEDTEIKPKNVSDDQPPNTEVQWKLFLIIGSAIFVVLIIAIVVLCIRMNARKKRGIHEKKAENRNKINKSVPKEKVYTRNNKAIGKRIRFDVYSDGVFTGRAEACVDGSIIIGRGGICDVIIDDPRISRQHLAVEYNEESFFVECLEPSNSTYFNDVKMTHKRRIEKGDRLRVDTLEIVIGW